MKTKETVQKKDKTEENAPNKPRYWKDNSQMTTPFDIVTLGAIFNAFSEDGVLPFWFRIFRKIDIKISSTGFGRTYRL